MSKVVNNARLKEALDKAVTASQTITPYDIQQDLIDRLSIRQARLLRVYLGSNEALIQYNNDKEDAIFLNLLDTVNTSIKYLPKGHHNQDEDGFKYIEMLEQPYVYIVPYDDTYLIIGYVNEGINTLIPSDIRISSGLNSITVNEGYVNIIANTFRVNGEDYSNNVSVDNLLDYLIENI